MHNLISKNEKFFIAGAQGLVGSAINDALNPLKLEVSSLPIRMHFVSDLIASHENNGKFKK